MHEHGSESQINVAGNMSIPPTLIEHSSGILTRNGGLNYGVPPRDAVMDSWKSMRSHDTQPYVESQMSIKHTWHLNKTPIKPFECHKTERYRTDQSNSVGNKT